MIVITIIQLSFDFTDISVLMLALSHKRPEWGLFLVMGNCMIILRLLYYF